MSLPSSIILPTLEFDDVSNISGSQVVYYAASPQGDLVGRPTLRISQEKTKAGIQRTLVSLSVPVYNGTALKYEGFIKCDMTLNRSESAPTANVMETLLNLADCFVPARAINTPVVNGLI